MKVLFVCLGNICRSPAAEGVARVVSQEVAGEYLFDSAGTGNWHQGQPPHLTMRQVAKEQGFPIDDLRARQVTAQDFHVFDWIVAMDRQNLADLKELQAHSGGHAKLTILLEDAPTGGVLDVPDPYYGGIDGFRESVRLIQIGVRSFFQRTGFHA
jgi:protein-tyrosine phosphatase